MNPTLFKYENNQVRVVDKGGNPWWVAKDVCAILGLSNVSAATKNLHIDEKDIIEVDTLGGPQKVLCVTEPGLY